MFSRDGAQPKNEDRNLRGAADNLVLADLGFAAYIRMNDPAR
jgi:hypothetical protein